MAKRTRGPGYGPAAGVVRRIASLLVRVHAHKAYEAGLNDGAILERKNAVALLRERCRAPVGLDNTRIELAAMADRIDRGNRPDTLNGQHHEGQTT